MRRLADVSSRWHVYRRQGRLDPALMVSSPEAGAGLLFPMVMILESSQAELIRGIVEVMYDKLVQSDNHESPTR